MRLNDQNTRVSDCIKAAVIDSLLGCVGLWAIAQYFLPGSEKDLRLLVCGLVVTPYCFLLAWQNLVRKSVLQGKPVKAMPRLERGPAFFALSAGGDLLLAWHFFHSASQRMAAAGGAGGQWLHLLPGVLGVCLFLCRAVVNVRKIRR